MQNNDFTEGSILNKLIRFMLPVLGAMFLQAMYGAVDLLVVGRFATNIDVSAVSTGSQILHTLTNIIVSFAMGITVVVARFIGRKDGEGAAKTIGTGILLFLFVGIGFTVLTIFGAPVLSMVMQAPTEAFGETVLYTRICGAGFLVICAYNLLGSIFRGLGDSKTPLIAVGIACVVNIIGDLVFVRVFHWGAAGAASATVLAQLASVIISLLLIRRQQLPVSFRKSHLRLFGPAAKNIAKIGIPIALQEFLVGISFLVLMAIVNSLGIIASAAIGVAEKVCAFIMLVPAAFMQSMSSFVSQNIGAGKEDRARKALRTGILVSTVFGVGMFLATMFFGDRMTAIFSQDTDVIAASFEYLKAYGIDCLLTCFLFCFIGYYNGIGRTTFVMVNGLIGAFAIRIPVALLMAKIGGGSLFLIGIAIPCSTVVQIALCFIALAMFNKSKKPIIGD